MAIIKLARERGTGLSCSDGSGHTTEDIGHTGYLN